MDYMIKTYSMGANPIVAIIIFSPDPSEIFRKCSQWRKNEFHYFILFSRALLTIYKQKSVFSLFFFKITSQSYLLTYDFCFKSEISGFLSSWIFAKIFNSYEYMLLVHPMERGILLSSKYVVLALAKRKQISAAGSCQQIADTCCSLYMCYWLLPIDSRYLLLALANRQQPPAAVYTNTTGSCQQIADTCCWLLPIDSSHLLQSIHVRLALANREQLPAAGSCQLNAAPCCC